MKKTFISFLLCFTVLASLFSLYVSAKQPAPVSGGFNTSSIVYTENEPPYKDYIGTGKAYGTMAGDVFGQIAATDFGAASVDEFETVADGIIALRNGRIDVFTADYVDLWLPEILNEFDDIEFLTIPADVYTSNLAPVFATEELRDSFNVFLSGIKKDGTLDEMFDFWFSSAGLPSEESIPRFELTGENGTLRATIDTGNASQGYKDSAGEYVGYSIELTQRFAQSLGMDIKWIDCDTLTALSYLSSGKSDIMSNLSTKTESRMEQMLYGDTVIEDPAMIIVRAEKNGQAPARDYTWFVGKPVGTHLGAITDSVVEAMGAIPSHYQDTASGVEDVRNDRISGFSTDLSTLRIFASEPGNKDLEVIEIPKSFFVGPMGAMASFENQALIDEFNSFLAVIEAEGVLEDIQMRWLDGVPDLNSPMPDLTYSGEKGVLRVATGGTEIPFDYVGANGELKGFSIDIMNRFAAHAGYIVEYYPMDLSAFIPAVVGGKADMAISSISITEERMQSVLFTNSIYNDQLGIITLKETGATLAAGTGKGFVHWFKTAVKRNLIEENRWKMILNGLGVTMAIAMLAQLLGTVLGCFLCWVLTRKNRFINSLGLFYSGLIHGLPMVVLLMISYYIIFGKTDISAMLIAVCAFALVEAASVALNLKASIDTVDPIEIEAARSMGFSAFGAFRAVTLPQAVQRAIPGYCNGFIELVKSTAIVGYISIHDLTRAGDIIRSRTYDAYFPLLLVALIYLLVTTICVQAFKLIVAKINKGVN